MRTNSSAHRILIYTHDSFGVGHVRRSMHIVQAVAEQSPQSSILLVTGSPSVELFKDIPQNADYVKLPTIAKSGAKANQPPTLGVGIVELSLLRRTMIQQIVDTFAPDVFLVDNFPLGSRQELVATLHQARRSHTRTLLGLRDIVDPPEKVRHDWTRHGITSAIDRDYDRILIYGVPEILDAADGYGLPSSVAAKIHYCGYVTADGPVERTRAEIRAELGVTGRLILATVGGGADGFPILRAFLQALPQFPDDTAMVITGEFMTPSDRAELHLLAADRSSIVIRGYESDLRSYMAAADVVVAMGGYNTIAEILALGARAIIVPRNWRSGENSYHSLTDMNEEQLIRARALHNMGLLDMVHPDSLCSDLLADRITCAFEAPDTSPTKTVDVGGLNRVANHILSMARGEDV